MARQQRYHIPGAFYHVMLRGNDGQKIFFCDADRCRMCLLIQQGVERYGHRIHAFCFMSNHIHLLVQVSLTPISKIIHNLAFRYSQNVNKRYHKIGHLFQGRFKAILLDADGYFLKLVRYIHMNPVRAKLVNEPTEYRWSGHKAYLGDDEFSWLTTEYTLAKFDTTLGEAHKLYNDYILQKTLKNELEELRSGFKDSQILGSDDFLKAIRGAATGQVIEQQISLSVIIDTACTVFEIEKTMISSASQSRKLSLARAAIVMLALGKGITLEEIAIIFKRDGSTLSSLRSRFLIKYQNCDKIRQQVEKLNENVNLQTYRPDPRSPTRPRLVIEVLSEGIAIEEFLAFK